MPTTPQTPELQQDSPQSKDSLCQQDSPSMQDRPRSGDRAEASIPRRSDRVFSDQHLWYFHTREDNDIGPFRYRSEAESNLAQFMEKRGAKAPEKVTDGLAKQLENPAAEPLQKQSADSLP